ncbi:MAG: alpha-N-arabinofuranosidase [Acidimicrobiales bacterium]
MISEGVVGTWLARAGLGSEDAAVRVAVGPSRTLGVLDRGIFGGFVEHLGRCINGGVFEEGSELSDERGYRQDVLELLRPLGISVLRWPGGNFASTYHWADGVGPRSARPRRANLAWGGEEPNSFGTDEFLGYCAELGASPYICLNMGSGSLQEALDWVEYCNATTRSYWAGQRRANGHEEPYGVTYWGLGNEMYGDWQVGQMTVEEYVATAARWAKALRRVSPGLKLVSCGLNGWSDWDSAVIDGLAGLVDLHSLHLYTGSDDYWANVLGPYQAQRAITTASALLSRAAYERRASNVAGIAYDEWNVWYRTDDGLLEERYSFDDALAVATYLNIFVRNCRWVKMANLAQLVNAIAPVFTSADEACTQTIYYPFLLHSSSALDEACDVWVAGPQVTAPKEPAGRWQHRLGDLGPFPIIDAAATTDRAHAKVCVTLVNRQTTDSTEVVVRLRDFAFVGDVAVRALTAGPPRLSGVLPEVETVKLEESTSPARGSDCHITLPPKSFVVLQASIAGE